MRFIESDIDRLRSRLRSLAKEPLRREAAPKLEQIDTNHAEEIFVTHGWLSGPIPKLKPTYAAITQKYIAKEKRIGNPTRLILVDEADRLKIVSLEQMRAIFDAGDIWARIDWNAWNREAHGALRTVLFSHQICP